MFRRGSRVASATTSASSTRSPNPDPRRWRRRARHAASDRLPPRHATRTARLSSSASETGNPTIRCRWPRAVSTSTNDRIASESSPTRIQAGRLADVGSVGRRSGFLPAELVAIVGDGPARALLIVLGRKLGQHAHGLVVDAGAVEQGCELFEVAVLEKADGLCARCDRGAVGSWAVPDCPDTSTGGARTDRSAGRACARARARTR